MFRCGIRLHAQRNFIINLLNNLKVFQCRRQLLAQQKKIGQKTSPNWVLQISHVRIKLTVLSIEFYAKAVIQSENFEFFFPKNVQMSFQRQFKNTLLRISVWIANYQALQRRLTSVVYKYAVVTQSHNLFCVSKVQYISFSEKCCIENIGQFWQL